jgi:hypothetical protein
MSSIIKPPTKQPKKNTILDIVKENISFRAKEYLKRSKNGTKKYNTVVPVPVTGLTLDTIIAEFPDNKKSQSHSTPSNRIGGKSRRKRTLKKRGGTRNSRQ